MFGKENITQILFSFPPPINNALWKSSSQKEWKAPLKYFAIWNRSTCVKHEYE